MASDTEKSKPPLRVEMMIYTMALFGNGASDMLIVVLPLLMISLGFEPLVIGTVIGMRSLLPLFLAIHGGALMDRFGARNIVLAFAVAAAVLPLLYPLSPWVWALIAIQLLTGLANTMCWAGAQTLIGQLMAGDPTSAGRFTLSSRIGTAIGPPLIGGSWDLWGAPGAFTVLSIWTSMVFVATLLLPNPRSAPDSGKQSFSARDLLPRLQDYKDAFKLLGTPAVALAVFASLMMIAGNGIQFSFYVVYLEGIGYTGTVIGILLSTFSFFSAVGALSAGPLARRFEPFTVLFLAIIGSILAIAMTPLFTALALLLMLAVGRGLVAGISHPLVVSNLSRSIGPGEQGKAVGLRTTANRLMGLMMPIVMGSIAQVIGVENSFFVVGAGAITLVALVFLVPRKYRSVGK